MTKAIKITAGQTQFEAELNDSPTAQAVYDALPIKAQGSRWGGEIYFTIPVEAKLEADSRDVLEAGELGYWPNGNAFCIFFGPTPASQADEIRAASAVNIIGEVQSDLSELWNISDRTDILIEAD